MILYYGPVQCLHYSVPLATQASLYKQHLAFGNVTYSGKSTPNHRSSSVEPFHPSFQIETAPLLSAFK